jgi:glutamate 5-kinase
MKSASEPGAGASRQRWVVKLGSALLTRDGLGLDDDAIGGWVDQLAALRRRGLEAVVVSSGSIAAGMGRLGMSRRPEALHELQALAAVGQMGLIQVYERAFQRHGTHTAQVLLTHDDVSDRRRYLNARTTFRSLLAYGVVPVVNENDTVATHEIRLGDNDTLAGLVSNLVEAEQLVILTDQAGLYTADPRRDPEARLVREGRAGDPALEAMAGGGGALGRGGMRTKLEAASLAARSGATTRIVSGREPDVLLRLFDGEDPGTRLRPESAPLAARKQWLAGQIRVRGRLWLDAGAVEVLTRSGRSLLAVGVHEVEGDFGRGEVVACVEASGREVARGLVNYDSAEVRKIKGLASGRILDVLGFVREPELIHRDNLVVLAR